MGCIPVSVIMKKFISIICAAVLSIAAMTAQTDTSNMDNMLSQDDTETMIISATDNSAKATDMFEKTSLHDAIVIISCFLALILMASCISFYKTYKYTSYWDEIKGHSKVNMILSICVMLLCLIAIFLS